MVKPCHEIVVHMTSLYLQELANIMSLLKLLDNIWREIMSVSSVFDKAIDLLEISEVRKL